MSVTYTFNSPIGAVCLTEEDGSITRIELIDATDETTAPTPLQREAARQILAFLRGERQQLEFPIRMVGTPFQQRVWHALRQIPYGANRTYGEIAAAIDNPRANRAVGMPATRILSCSSSPATAYSAPMANSPASPTVPMPSNTYLSWRANGDNHRPTIQCFGRNFGRFYLTGDGDRYLSTLSSTSHTKNKPSRSTTRGGRV